MLQIVNLLKRSAMQVSFLGGYEMNSSERTYTQKQFLLAFCEPEAANEAKEYSLTKEQYLKELQEYDEGIAECHGMFLYYKDEGNKEEMAYWRTMEQEAKTAKRLMMKKYQKEETAA